MSFGAGAGIHWHQYCLVRLRLRVASLGKANSSSLLYPSTLTGWGIFLDLFVEQGPRHLVTRLEYGQIGQKRIFCLQLRHQVGL